MNTKLIMTKIETPDGVVYDSDQIRKFLRQISGSMVLTWDNWFNGQTGVIFEGKYCVFDYDFERFCGEHGISIE